MFNVKGAAQVSLGIFGGLVSNMPAMNLPPGVSPDLLNMAFRPGATFTRPGAARVFGANDTAVPVYGKSYIANDKVIRNLYMDADGNLTVENLNTSPLTKTLVGTFTPGSKAKSITAYGREFIAPSDGLAGSDIPMHYDGTNLDRVSQDGPGSPPSIESVFVDPVAMDPVLGGTDTMQRVSNVVTVATAAAHNLQVGYKARITGITAAAIGGGITSIVINNQDAPGVAIVTTASPHGLAPGARVSVSGVAYVDVPGSIIHVIRQGQNVQIEMSAPHGLSEGAFITVVGTVDDTFLGSFIVQTVQSPTIFGYQQAEPTNVNATEVGNVRLQWPTAAIQVYEVISAPSDDTFQIGIQYTNGAWVSGDVSYEWEGEFFVTGVLAADQFTYQQYGPDAVTTEVGLVTPSGQAAPGRHRMMVLYETRGGYVTAPSPWIEFVANGGQYLHVEDLPIGPANVVARILAFTGADGSAFFYIPVPAQVNGVAVSTATVVHDNTTTEVTLDFSDNTLFRGLGISQPGNDLQSQVVLDGALGFALLDNRLVTYGQRNRVNQFRNMAFDGGALPSAPTLPTGWTPDGAGAGGALVTTGRWGGAWQFSGAGFVYQSAYLTSYGAPILTANTQYTLRAWVKDGSVTVTISSASAAFSTTATLGPASVDGEWLQADFDDVMPDSIPEDLVISLAGDADAILDELSIIFTLSPFKDTVMYGSYINNPEAFDGVSGQFGVQDTRKVMTHVILRGALHVLTQDPSGRLHVIQNNGVTEPSGWQSLEVASDCGAVSTFSATVSQANDGTASGGEQWFAWMSASGARVFGGDQAFTISQEIQPNISSINPQAWGTVWVLNDLVSQRLYFGLPIDDATTPNWIYHMDYKTMDTAAQIAAADPVSETGAGNSYGQERARKWGPWDIPTTGPAAAMYRAVGGKLETVLLGANNIENVFLLVEQAEDAWGPIDWYYFTYAFTGEQGEQSYQIGGQRKLLQYLQWNARGTGYLKVTVFPGTLSNPWPLNVTVKMREDPRYDDEWGAGQASGQRFFLKFEPGVAP